jgi:hypothetical protein
MPSHIHTVDFSADHRASETILTCPGISRHHPHQSMR